MSDRLLTPDEMPERWGAPVGDMIDLFGNLLATQDAKSVKVDRQAASGWFMGICSEHKHAPLEHRIDCDECICELPELLRGGKAPWEEGNAVHTTRKTPRTIPPD